eukprot:5534402-Alexandrium_andersonii.AAC.1
MARGQVSAAASCLGRAAVREEALRSHLQRRAPAQSTPGERGRAARGTVTWRCKACDEVIELQVLPREKEQQARSRSAIRRELHRQKRHKGMDGSLLGYVR